MKKLIKIICFTLLTLTGAMQAMEPLKRPRDFNTLGLNLALITAAKEGHAEAIPELISQGADVNFPHPLDGMTALMYAARDGKTGCVNALIAAGANLNCKDTQYGFTPLIWAMQQCNRTLQRCSIECFEALMNAQADVNCKDQKKNTPLIHAVRVRNSRRLDFVQALLAAKAEVNHEGNYGNTALIEAAAGGDIGCVQALLAAKVDINYANFLKTTALILAAQHNRKEVCEILVEAIQKTHQEEQQKIVAFMGSRKRETCLLNEWKVPRDAVTLIGTCMFNAAKHAASMTALTEIQKIPNTPDDARTIKQHLLAKYYPAHANPQNGV